MDRNQEFDALTFDGSTVDLSPEQAQQLLRDEPIRIGISTRALFDLREEHSIYKNGGVGKYVQFQRDHEGTILKPGVGFPLISKLLSLNEPGEKPYVQVILLSRNSPDLSLRAFNSAEEYKLPIHWGSFTSGKALTPYLTAWQIDLFLTADEDDAKQAAAEGAGAVHIGNAAPPIYGPLNSQLNVAFDGDAVIFGPESDLVYKSTNLDTFLRHERENALNPMSPGPLSAFYSKLSHLRIATTQNDGRSKVRIAVVTARSAPAHARVVHTLRARGTPADEAHFVGGNDKSPLLLAFGADIFFDDQLGHVQRAEKYVPAGQVPGPHEDGTLITPGHQA